MKRPSESTKCTAARRLGATVLVVRPSYQRVRVTVLLGRSFGWIGRGGLRVGAAVRVPHLSHTGRFKLGVQRGAAATADAAVAFLTGVWQCGEGTVPEDGDEESNPFQIHPRDCKRVMNRRRRPGGGSSINCYVVDPVCQLLSIQYTFYGMLCCGVSDDEKWILSSRHWPDRSLYLKPQTDQPGDLVRMDVLTVGLSSGEDVCLSHNYLILFLDRQNSAPKLKITSPMRWPMCWA